MPKLEQRILKNDVRKAETDLLSVANEYGKNSTQYRVALQRFVRLWSILKMTRSRDEFFQEVNKVSR